MGAWVIAVANQKGGVGKTTTVLNLGWELAKQNRRTLLVDLDPQSSLTQLLGMNAPSASLADVMGLLEPGTTTLPAIIREVAPGLDLAPGDIALSRTELGLVVRMGRDHQLANALVPVLANYDVILVDCPPSLGLLTTNALVASRSVLVPTNLDVVALRGLGLFMETIAELRASQPQVATLLGVAATMADLRPVHARDVLTAMRQRDDFRLFKTVIPRSVRFSEAAIEKLALAVYEPNHAGALAYAALAEEVLQRGA